MLLYHVTPAENLPRIQAEGLVPAIGPRAERMAESTPAVYGFPTREDCEDALLNWLGEQFDEEAPLVVLELDVTGLAMAKPVVNWECAVLECVTPERIRAVHQETEFYALSGDGPALEPVRQKAA